MTPMTEEELTRFVTEGDGKPLVAALAPLTEPERRKLSKLAQKLHRKLNRGELPDELDGTLARRIKARLLGGADPSWSWDMATTAALAVLGLGPLSALRRLTLWSWQPEVQDAIAQILRDRRPDWIDDWIAHDVEQEAPTLRFTTIRALTREGVCERPVSDGYVRLMALQLNEWSYAEGAENTPLSRRILADPALLENELWRLFEVETSAFSTDWVKSSSQRPEPYETWPDALLRLCREGTIDRDRLLDGSLEGLASGLPPHLLSGMHKLHAEIDPGADELAERESRYRALLGGPVGHVVGFALRQLRSLEKVKRLDAARLIAELGPVFSLEGKGTAKTAIAFAGRIHKSRPDLAAPTAELAIEALAHPAAEVQERAVDLLEQLGPSVVSNVSERIAMRMEHVRGALRQRLVGILPSAADATLVETGTVSGEVDTSASAYDQDLRENVEQRIAALPPGLRARAGLCALEEMSGHPPPLDVDPMSIRVTEIAEPVSPIVDLDALLDAVAHALELVDSCDELERILDGLSRLCAERPADFASRTTPLLRRLDQPTVTEAGRGITTGWSGTHLALGDLLRGWITGRRRRSPHFAYYQLSGPFPFFQSRARELTGRVVARTPAPLLAAPTHRGGWIAPAALVERVRALEASGVKPLKADLVQALLRIAPDRRDEALLAASDLGGDVARVLRFALGGDDGPARGDGGSALAWTAAARARAPRAEHTGALAPLLRAPDGPDGTRPAMLGWRATERRWKEWGTTKVRPTIEVTVDPPPPAPAGGILRGIARAFGDMAGAGLDRMAPEHAAPIHALPTVAMHQIARHPWQTPEFSSPWLVAWGATVWPLSMDAWFLAGARMMAERIDQDASGSAPDYVWLEPLFDGTRPWSEPACVALVVGLCAKDADARGLAVDALIEGIEGGRAHPAPIGEVLVRVDEGGWLKPNRIAQSLGDVGRVGLLHAAVGAEILEHYVAGWSGLPRNAHHPLEVLLDLLSELGRGVAPPTRVVLETATGKSKAATLARRITELPASRHVDRTPEIAALAALARLQWLERSIDPAALGRSDRAMAANEF